MENKKGSGNQPEKKFSTGAISATIWKNTGKRKDGQSIEFRTITLQRRYKDKNDEWQSTNSLRVSDVPKAVLVLNEAYKDIVLKDNSGTGDAEPSPEEEAFEEIVM